VRFPRATHLVLGFQREEDARKMREDLETRLKGFGLSLHEGKTRLMRFGKFAKALTGKRPETFNFLGFTHYCGEARDGRFVMKRKTQQGRIMRKLKELRKEARRRMHGPIGEQHKWLVSVVRGHYAYYGLPGNLRSMASFLWEVQKLWFRVLRRRGQKGKMNWERFNALIKVFPLPTPKITHPWSERPAA
jgi:hypothetical protein